ncbi:MAG: hypothetical protein ING59_09185 [Burkholderiales bacterium]|nr:hypothetical protein [Burkholderiales bacterium]
MFPSFDSHPIPPRAGWLPRAALPLTVLLLATGCLTTAPAQPSNGPVTTSGDERVIDPPGRVGKIGLLAGTVTLTDTRTGDTEAATLNWPITSGHRLATARGARTEVRVGSLAVRLDGESMVDFNRVDDQFIQLVVQSGSVALRVRNTELLREIDVLTPRERIKIEDAGRYRIDVDRVPGVTGVTAHVGQARITGSGGRMVFLVQSGQRGEARAEPATGFQLVTAAPDVFDDWVAGRDRRDDVIASTRYVSPETTGIEVLDDHGSWRTVSQYGTVWFPAAVPVGWAPYRFGRWAFVAPWGWTWIDDAPWGFAPSHYGRWVVVGGVWGWMPGVYVARPIYAPALVGWYATPGVSVSVSVGYPVGWFPLGWREPYIPAWRHSPRYIAAINGPYVSNPHSIAPPPRYVYQAPGTATWAPNDAILRAKPIQRVVRDVPAEYVRAPAAAAPSLPVPSGFTKRIVPVSGDIDPRAQRRVPAGAPGGTAERVIAPRAIATPDGGIAPATPGTIDPGAIRPQPKIVVPGGPTPPAAPRVNPPTVVQTPVVQPKVSAPGAAPPVVQAPQRTPELVTRPRPVPMPESGAPGVQPPAPPVPSPPPARVAPPAQVEPPMHMAPPPAVQAPVQRDTPTPKVIAPPDMGAVRGAPPGGPPAGGGKVIRD